VSSKRITPKADEAACRDGNTAEEKCWESALFVQKRPNEHGHGSNVHGARVGSGRGSSQTTLVKMRAMMMATTNKEAGESPFHVN
jgi:hypothetical protein